MQSEFDNSLESNDIDLKNTNCGITNNFKNGESGSSILVDSNPVTFKSEGLIVDSVIQKNSFLIDSEVKEAECLKRERVSSIVDHTCSSTNDTPLKRRAVGNETENLSAEPNTILNIDLRSPILCESMCLNTRLSDTSEGTTISSPNTPFKHMDNAKVSKVAIPSDASKSTTATTSPTMSYRISSSTFSETLPNKTEVDNCLSDSKNEKAEDSCEKVENNFAETVPEEEKLKANLTNTSIQANHESSYNLQQFAAAAAAGCVPFTIISLPNGQNVALTATPMSSTHSNISSVDNSKENCFHNQENVTTNSINNVVHESNLLNQNNSNSNFNAAVIAAAQQAAAFASNYPVATPNIQGFSWPPAPAQVAVPGINAFQPGTSSALFFPVDMTHNNHGFINLPWHNTPAYGNLQNGTQTVNQQLAQIQANLQEGNGRVGDMSSVSTPYRMISPQHSNAALWNNNHFNGLGGDTSALSALSFAPQLLNLSGLPSPSSTTSSASQKPSLTFSDVDGGTTGSPTFVSVLRNSASQQAITHMNQKDMGMNHISSLLSAAAAVSNQNGEEPDNIKIGNRNGSSYDTGNKCAAYGKNVKSSLKVNSANVSAALDGLDVDWNSVGLREAELATHEVAKNAASLFEDSEGNNSALISSPGEAVLTASQLTVAARAMLKFVKGLTPTQLGINWHACTQRFCVTYTTPDETDSRTWILGAYSNGKLHYKYFGPRSWTLLGLKEALRKAFKARTSLLLGQGIIEEPEDTGLSKEELTFHARQLLQQLRDSLGVKKGNVHKGLYISWHPKTRRFVVALKSCDSGKTVYKYFSPKERSIEGIKTALLDAHQMVVAACQ